MEQPSWARRRRYMYVVTAVCIVSIGWILGNNMTGSVAEAGLTMSFICLMSMTGYYVAGATWQDVKMGNR